MRKCTIALITLATLLHVAAGQAIGQVVRSRRFVLPELRADVIAADPTTAHVGLGVHVNSGTYVRLAALGGVGSVWSDGERGTSYRIEFQTRFHLDPFRASRFGLYGIGGMSGTHVPEDWHYRLVVGAGVELPAHARTAVAIETALAGGFRISVVTRRLPLGRR
jgi:hypothetical protein